jgi:hypothetical protein
MCCACRHPEIKAIDLRVAEKRMDIREISMEIRRLKKLLAETNSKGISTWDIDAELKAYRKKQFIYA